MIRTFGLAAASALVCLVASNWTALAQTPLPQSPPIQSPARLASGAIDANTSRVHILVDKTGLGHAHGVVGRLRGGSLKLDAKSSAGQIVFDMATFVADTDEARKYVGLSDSSSASTQQQVTNNMLGSDVLDVKKFPTATFTVDSAVPQAKLTAAGNRVYELRGTFQLHGVNQPVAVAAEAFVRGNVTRLRGKFTIQQTKFGMKPYTAALGAVGVADQLTIWGDIDINE